MNLKTSNFPISLPYRIPSVSAITKLVNHFELGHTHISEERLFRLIVPIYLFLLETQEN